MVRVPDYCRGSGEDLAVLQCLGHADAASRISWSTSCGCIFDVDVNAARNILKTS